MSRMETWVAGQYCSGCKSAPQQCQGGTTAYQSSPYTHAGGAFAVGNNTCDLITTGYTLQKENNRCTGEFDVASSCTGVDGVGTWSNPINVWRDVPPM